MPFPSECVLERRVRSDGDADLNDTNLQLFILECEDRQAVGYPGKLLQIYNKRLQGMKIGVRLGTPPAVSYLAILGARLYAKILAVHKTGIVISLVFTCGRGRRSYLIYDAVAKSLRMIPTPEDPSWIYTISSKVSFARGNASYALVHRGRMVEVDKVDNLYLWRPSSSSMPWSEKRKPTSWDLIVYQIDADFSFNGRVYWVDLLGGASYYSCDALFDDNSGQVEFGFIPLPVEDSDYHRNPKKVAQPVAYRTMGVVRDSIRFVSINGFQEHVKLKKRTVTVWRLLGHDLAEPWVVEHEFSLKELWEFEGFGDLPKKLTPMYPLLSTKNTDVVYLVLGECLENLNVMPCDAHYLLAVDMGKKIVTYVPLAGWSYEPFVPCCFSQGLRTALAGPCNDKGIPIPNPKKRKPFVPCRFSRGLRTALPGIPISKKKKKPKKN